MASVASIAIGVLHDHPSGDGGAGFERAARLGIADAAGAGGLDREIELVHVEAEGLPRGTAHAVEQGFAELVDRGVLAILGPAITDNALVARDLAGAARIPCINWSGSEKSRSDWMFHYQVGSLEEEGVVLARHLAGRGITRVALVFDRSTIGRVYTEFFDAACTDLGIEIVGRRSISPVDDDVVATVEALRASGADALAYLGLGMSAGAVASAATELEWTVPKVANAALMFGYADAAMAQAFEGWIYVDAVSDSNPVWQRLVAELGAAAARGPGAPAAYDMGQLVARAVMRADQLTRAGIREGLERVKLVPAALGRDGTTITLGQWQRAALHGEYLVLREWVDGESREWAV